MARWKIYTPDEPTHGRGDWFIDELDGPYRGQVETWPQARNIVLFLDREKHRPALNRVGDLPHAHPADLLPDTTCTLCGAAVYFDDYDDEGAAIWTHTLTLDYFCEGE